MFRRRCALLPLGAARGDEALNTWEHIAFAEWLERHGRPGEGRREARLWDAFEAELSFWEAQEFYGPSEAMESLDSPDFEDDFCREDDEDSQAGFD